MSQSGQPLGSHSRRAQQPVKGADGASSTRVVIDATKKIPGEGFKRPWLPLIKMDTVVKAKVEKLFKL